MTLTTLPPPVARERLRQQLVPHLRATVVDATANCTSPEETVDRLVWIADLYAVHAAALPTIDPAGAGAL